MGCAAWHRAARLHAFPARTGADDGVDDGTARRDLGAARRIQKLRVPDADKEARQLCAVGLTRRYRLSFSVALLVETRGAFAVVQFGGNLGRRNAARRP